MYLFLVSKRHTDDVEERSRLHSDRLTGEKWVAATRSSADVFLFGRVLRSTTKFFGKLCCQVSLVHLCSLEVYSLQGQRDAQIPGNAKG